MGSEIVPESRQRAIAESRKRAYAAIAGGVLTGVLALTVGVVPWAMLGAGVTVWLAWRWVSHRIRSGIRF